MPVPGSGWGLGGFLVCSEEAIDLVFYFLQAALFVLFSQPFHQFPQQRDAGLQQHAAYEQEYIPYGKPGY